MKSVFDHVYEAEEAIKEAIEAVDDLGTVVGEPSSDALRQIIRVLDGAADSLAKAKELIY